MNLSIRLRSSVSGILLQWSCNGTQRCDFCREEAEEESRNSILPPSAPLRASFEFTWRPDSVEADADRVHIYDSPSSCRRT